MLSLNLDSRKTSHGLNILLLGCHADDIEIGCGGTILKLLQNYSELRVCWVVFSAEKERSLEARKSASIFLRSCKRKQVVIKNFKTSFFPFQAEKIKQYFEKLKHSFEPDILFTHYRHDLHQDHRVISDLAWNTFRDHLILEYEIPKYDGDLGTPNVFFQLEEGTVEQKIGHVLQHFKSQQSKHWFTSDTFRSLMRLRGIECASKTRYAEAFYCRKLAVS